ncbi:hypothetical protein RHSIM_Rhsim08G0197200 [Rhododendron simsii]|uniref:RRM domain-containing protein n=1 Tax=Rhododendron simsii TaxID=118357 RepID=A0A834LGV4_RHOSS|nr:hypothetical protein RHSIM_Rhsim08G0197200 [Rhododendron simsii]
MGTEEEVGFWKPQTMRYCQEENVQMALSKSAISSPLENLFSAGALSGDWFQLQASQGARDCKVKYRIGGSDANPNSYFESVCGSGETNKPTFKGTQPGNSISSMSSEVFGRKSRAVDKLLPLVAYAVGLPLNNFPFHKSAADTVASSHEEEEPFGSMEEMEAQTIGNLLPDEADLFSGAINGLEYNCDAKGGDDADDFDLFSSVGGMELELDGMSCAGQTDSNFTSEVSGGWGSSNGSLSGTHPYGETPSRTLLVRNLSSQVEDSELMVLFKPYGDVRNLHTACKHRGFAVISYFDIRAATNAMRALQTKQLGHRKLDIHYSIPKDNPLEKDISQGTVVVFGLNTSFSDDDLHRIFGIYGEIKEIREVPLKFYHKCIEFYDVRAAEAACRALNKCNVAGKPAGSFMQSCSELEQDKVGLSIGSNDITPSESTRHVTLSTLTEKVLSHGSFSGLNSLPSPLSVGSSGSHYGLQKPCHSMDQLKFSSKCIPSSLPHSFPDSQDNFKISLSRNFPSTVANMAGDIGSKLSGRIDGRHTSMVVSNGQRVELNGGVSGSSGNATCPVHRHHWSNSNLFQHHPSSPIAWPSSPLFSSHVNAPFAPQLPAFSGMPPELLKNTFSPPHHLHGGSAPSSSPSLLDRRHIYTGESPEDLAFGLGSLGGVGFRGSSPLHPLGRASHVVSRSVETWVQKSKVDALHSPHQTPGKNTVTPLPTSFGYPYACGRNLSHRRNQGGSSHPDKKQFELDTERILHAEDRRTTLMIKNIPNKYTSKMLLTTIDEHCRGTYDFIYLPIDFKNKCNVGYAFINMIDPLQIIPFFKAFNGKKWEKFNSEKVAALAYARIQGKSALVAHFQNSSLMNEDKRCRPILFCTDGPNAGEQEPFPVGTNIRLKAGKARSSVIEEIDLQRSPSSSVSGEDSPNRSDSSGSMKESY